MNPETTEESVITFGYVPVLGPGPGTLMPRTGGMPGVKYAQICTHHIVKARRDHWDNVRDAEPYVIEGPAGSAEVVLMCQGEPIRNASCSAGARECKLDREIYTLTGFPDPDGDTEEPQKNAKPAKPGKANEEIQARVPSV